MAYLTDSGNHTPKAVQVRVSQVYDKYETKLRQTGAWGRGKQQVEFEMMSHQQGHDGTLWMLWNIQTHKPGGFYGPRSGWPQFGMPAECRAQLWVPNVPRSWISERAPLRIYEHAQCRFFERTSLQRAYVIPCRQQMGSSALQRTCRSALVLAASTLCLRRAHSIGRGWRVHTCVMAIGTDFESNFFYNTQEIQTQKNDGPEF